MRHIWMVAALLATAILPAQPAIAWHLLYGGSGSDRGFSMDRTSDGGYIALSVTNSNNGLVSGFHGGEGVDLWVVKVDAQGILEWQRCLGGTNLDTEGCIRSCADGGYIVIGSTQSDDGDVSLPGYGLADIWVVKLTAAGEITWQQRYGGGSADKGHRIEQLSNGGFVLMAMTQSNDGHIIGNNGDVDYWIAWLNANGELVSAHCFGGSSTELLVGDMAVLADGTIVATGATYSNDGDVSGNHPGPGGYSVDAWVFSTNPSGDLLWQHCLGGTNNETGWTITHSPDGTTLVGVLAYSSDGDVSTSFGLGDTWIARLDANGDLLDQVSLGGTGGENPWDMQLADNDDIYVLSQTNSLDGHISEAFGTNDTWLCRLSPELDLLWQRSYGGSLSDFGRELVLNPDGSLCFAGSTASTDNGITGNYGSADLWVVKLEAEDLGLSERPENVRLAVYPSPAAGELFIRWDDFPADQYEVLDNLGQLCCSAGLAEGASGAVRVPLESLAQGVYVLRLIGAPGSITARFVKD